MTTISLEIPEELMDRLDKAIDAVSQVADAVLAVRDALHKMNGRLGTIIGVLEKQETRYQWLQEPPASTAEMREAAKGEAVTKYVVFSQVGGVYLANPDTMRWGFRAHAHLFDRKEDADHILSQGQGGLIVQDVRVFP